MQTEDRITRRIQFHFPTCNPNYPEKPKDEEPRAESVQRWPSGAEVRCCIDCGSMVLIDPQGTIVAKDPERASNSDTLQFILTHLQGHEDVFLVPPPYLKGTIA